MQRAILLMSLVLFAGSAVADDRETLHKLFEDEWQWQLRDLPEGATSIGDRRYDDRLADRSAAAWTKRREHARELLARIEAIDRSKLSADDQLNYDLFLYQARSTVEQSRFPVELTPVDQMTGIHMLLGELAQQMPRDTVKDYENFIARLRAYPRAVDDTIALL